MNKSLIYFLLVLMVMGFGSCNNEEKQILPPYEERVSSAVTDLTNELLNPPNGWRINYKPNPESGTYLVLMQFDEDGEVRIQSDLSADDGEYYDQTAPYRVDVALDVELILETYGFFHFLFELNRSTFGGEFEFLFVEKQGENLIFESSSDFGNKTVLVFEPAEPNDDQLFSREQSENLQKFVGYTPFIFGQIPSLQQLYLGDKNISVFWAMDPNSRVVNFQLIGEGSTIEEIIQNDEYIEIFHESGFTLENGKMILLNPVTFNVTGEEITIEEITLNQFSYNGQPLCSTGGEGTPQYLGQISGAGSMTMSTTLISTGGFGFKEDNVYTVNAFFVFDSLGNSLLEDGIIGENYPEAGGFAFLYGAQLINDSIPRFSTGIIDAVGDLNVREFDSTTTIGNKVNVMLKNDFYFSRPSTVEDEQKITEVTDDIYTGGEIYAFEYPATGVVIFRLYNPCNKYEFALVQ